ncbi:TPA: VENN motif pre-toxin domain-containing protein [Mannheimia haemolytica]
MFGTSEDARTIGVEGKATIGWGASGSASYSKSKMNADYASVKQQTGIFAGDEGYDVDIQNHTELTAGLVTSTEKAETEGKNRFSTGTLNATNLDNHADYKGSAVGVSAAGDYKGGWNGQRVDKEGKPTHSLSNAIGYGKDQDSQSSQTTSGIAHAIWGAVEAYTQGGKASTGAVAAVTGEMGANIISQNIFGKEPENLTEAEKRTVSELSQVAAGLAGGLASSSGSSLSTAQAVKTGQGVGKNAVENNYLSKQDWIDYKRDITACGNNQECIEQVKEEFTDINKANSETLKAACRLGGNTEECAKHTSLAKEGFDYARENVHFDGSGWMAKIMNANKAEAKTKPTEGLLGSEAITHIENALSNPGIRNKVENDPIVKRELTKGIDQAASAVRTEKTNAYEFSAKLEYPNISGLSNDYRVFGRELGAEPVVPEYYLSTALGAGKLGKTLFDLSSTSTRVIVGANGAVSAGAQYLTNGEVSVKETLKDMGEAYITKDFSFKGYTAWNIGTGFLGVGNMFDSSTSKSLEMIWDNYRYLNGGNNEAPSK